jgi:hypothetical protein
MPQTYTPGLKVSPRCRWRTRRTLPLAGEVLVEVGQRVTAQQIVAQTELPGPAVPINLARMLGALPGELPQRLMKREGERITASEPIARTKGLFGLFEREFPSPATGVLESVSKVTGQIIVRGDPIAVRVKAYLSGTVVEVVPNYGAAIEAEAAVVQGIFGIGGEAYGVLRFACAAPDQPLSEDRVLPEHAGCVLIGGARMTGAAVRRAAELRVSAVVSGGIDDQDLKDILGFDLGVAVTGTETIGTTVIVTEGFGDIAMARRTFDLLQQHAGREVSVTGATQIRAGVMRPEIVICLDQQPEVVASRAAQVGTGTLTIGAAVRVIREPYFGWLGTVCGLPHELQTLDSGSKARVVQVKLADGRQLTVPRANVELVEA